MIFNHRKTNKPALWITSYDESWENQDDPDLYRIKKYEDLPDIDFSKEFPIPPEIHIGLGKQGLYAYFRAFLKEDGENENDFWLLIMKCGFPKEEK